jgi:hypothetical protein
MLCWGSCQNSENQEIERATWDTYIYDIFQNDFFFTQISSSIAENL